MFKSIFFFATLFLLLFVGNLYATNYYVSTASSGNASANSWTNKKIITSFIWSQVVGGDTVFIDGGTDSLTYGRTVISDLLPSSQVVITKGKDVGHNGKVIIRQTGITTHSTLTLENCKNVKITGLTIKTDSDAGSYECYGVLFTSGGETPIDHCNNILDNCHIIGNAIGNSVLVVLTWQTKDIINNCIMEYSDNSTTTERDGINADYGGGGHTITGNTVILRGSLGSGHDDCMQWGDGEGLNNNYETVIANNYFSNLVGMGNSGLLLYNLNSNRFLIYNNMIALKGVSDATSIMIVPVNATYNVSARIYNNTIVNNTPHGFGVWLEYLDTLVFKNNLVLCDSVGNSVFYTRSGTTSTGLSDIKYKDIDYNQYYMNGHSIRIDTSYTAGITWAQWQALGYDTLSDTGMVSFANIWGTNIADYLLSTGSAGIDAGTNLSTYFTTDILGTTRPQGAAWDIGAFQHTPKFRNNIKN